MRRFSLTPLGAVAALLLVGSAARADFIEWSYNWTPSVTQIFSDTSETSFLRLTNEPGAVAAGSSDIVATNIFAASDAPRGIPDTLETGGGFALTMRLTDTMSGEFADLVFDGDFSGSFTSASANVEVTWTGATSHLVTLGNAEYMVEIGPYSPPGPPGSSNAGSIAAHIEVMPLDDAKLPEPSTIVLSGVGLSCLGFAGWRKRRLAAKA